MMLVDISSMEKSLVGKQIGSYNRKFVEKWGKHFVKSFGEDGKKVGEYTNKQLTSLLQAIHTKIHENMGSLGQGYEKVSTFSEWLDAMDINDFHNPYEYIEVPG